MEKSEYYRVVGLDAEVEGEQDRWRGGGSACDRMPRSLCKFISAYLLLSINLVVSPFLLTPLCASASATKSLLL